MDVAMCEDCNPLGLSQPAASQIHGTVIVTVGLAIVALAVLGRVLLSGIGPFDAGIAGVTSDGNRLTVTLSVTNDGSRTGSTTCRVTRSGGTSGAVAIVQSPHIEPGATVTFHATTEAFGSEPVPLVVSCEAP
jgi:hypothetical protein